MVFLYTPPVIQTKALDVNKKVKESSLSFRCACRYAHRYGGLYLFLNSIYNKIGDDGAGRLAGVLA